MKNGLVRSLALTVGLALLTSCGGGGGGSTSAGYTGITTQATVTTANARALSADAYENAGMGAGANIAGIEIQSSPAVSGPLVQEVAALLKDNVAKAITTASAAPTTVNGVVVQQTFNGAYGGSASFTIDANQSTGQFSGTIIFTSYRESAGGPALTGTVTATGVYNGATFSSMSITFSPLTVSENGTSSTMYGTVTFAVSGSTETLTVSCTVQNSAGKVFWVKDWTFSLSGSTTLTITGRYYEPSYGYVDITTPTPLTVNSLSGNPTAGVLLFSGSNGTKARITFDVSGYTVSVDTAGNGQFVTVP